MLQVTRYITPLREGGSLPAIVEANDNEKYVLKFKGAGQGTKALIAEYLGGKIAERLGFLVPKLVFCNLDEGFGRTEPDEEIQDLLQTSVGLNLGMQFLPGAISFDPVVNFVPDIIASMIVWLDMYLTNVDRTARNTNMLMWHKELWLIDHGASLYFHHTWDNWAGQSQRPFFPIKSHVLLPQASELEAVDAEFRAKLTAREIRDIVALVPDEWLVAESLSESADQRRQVYVQFLEARLVASEIFVKEAQNARKTLV